MRLSSEGFGRWSRLDLDSQISLFQDVSNVEERAFAGHAGTSPLIDLIGRNHVEPQEIVLVCRFADFEENRVLVSVQAEIPAVIHATEVSPDFGIDEALIDELQQLLGLVIACRAKVALLVGARMPEQWAVFFVVGEAVEAERELDAHVAGGELVGPHRWLQMRHTELSAVNL